MTILYKCCMVQKSYMDWPEIEHRPPGRNVGNEQPVLWHGDFKSRISERQSEDFSGLC
jgi:hypothetical protein